MERAAPAEERSCSCCVLPQGYQIIPHGTPLLLSNNRFFIRKCQFHQNLPLFLFPLPAPLWFFRLLVHLCIVLSFFPKGIGFVQCNSKALKKCTLPDSGLSRRGSQEKMIFCTASYKLVMECVCSWYLLIVWAERGKAAEARIGRKLSLSFHREFKAQWIHFEG